MFAITDRSTDSCIGVKVKGEISANDYDALQPILDNAIEAHNDITLVLEAQDFEGHADMSAILADVRMSIDSFDHIDRVAVVSESKWQDAATTLLDPLALDTEMKHFDPSDRDAAWTWACGSDAWRS